MKKVKVRNFVQKNVQLFNSPQVFTDKKKEFKKGNTKYKSEVFKDYSKELSKVTIH